MTQGMMWRVQHMSRLWMKLPLLFCSIHVTWKTQKKIQNVSWFCNYSTVWPSGVITYFVLSLPLFDYLYYYISDLLVYTATWTKLLYKCNMARSCIRLHDSDVTRQLCLCLSRLPASQSGVPSAAPPPLRLCVTSHCQPTVFTGHSASPANDRWVLTRPRGANHGASSFPGVSVCPLVGHEPFPVFLTCFHTIHDDCDSLAICTWILSCS